MTEHDIPLSAIVTPKEIIEVKSPFKRPNGIYWKMLLEDKIKSIPSLKSRNNRKEP